MNRLSTLLAFSSLMLLGFTGCSAKNSSDFTGVGASPVVSSSAKRTTLIYMVGSTLTDQAAGNIGELLSSTTNNSNVNIVLETGGAKVDGWTTTKRHLVQGDDLELLDDLGIQNMGKGSTLDSFIEWAVKTYPADKYDLILWDHGGGSVGGFGPDESTATPTTMSVAELTAAVATAEARTGTRFEMLGFDACLMASLEVAAQLQPYTDYYVASEDLEPGAGWDYTSLRDFLNTTPDADGSALGQSMVQAFLAKMQRDGEAAGATLAVVDMAQLPKLVSSTTTLAAAMQSKLSQQGAEGWNDIAVARRLTDSYYTSPLPLGPSLDLVDLGDFASQLSDSMPDTTKAVANAMRAAVIFHDEGVVHKGKATGLTLYVPRTTAVSGSTMLSTYLSQAVIPPYDDFLKNYVELATSQQAISIPAPTIGADGVMSAPVPAVIADFFVALGDGDGNVYALQSAYGNRDGVTLFPESQWPMLGSQYLITLNISGPSSQSAQLLATPVEIEPATGDDPINATLILAKDWISGAYQVLGWQRVSQIAGQELASRVVPFVPGDVVYPLSYRPANANWILPSSGITVPSTGLKITLGKLPSSPYSVQFGAVPLAGPWSFGEVLMHP